MSIEETTMAKAVILDGTPEDDPGVQALDGLVATELAHLGFKATTFVLRNRHITHCRGCFECWTRHPGRCKFKDDGKEIAASVITSDWVVFITPVTFGGYSAALKKALDRMVLCLLLPFFTTIDGEVHHRKRYHRYPRVLGIGTLRHPDPASEKIFKSLVQRNAVNMHTTGHSMVLHLDGHTPASHRDKLREWFKGLELAH